MTDNNIESGEKISIDSDLYSNPSAVYERRGDIRNFMKKTAYCLRTALSHSVVAILVLCRLTAEEQVDIDN